MAKRKNTEWAWAARPKIRSYDKKEIPQAWYSSKAWMACRDRKLSTTPFCEISEHFGIDHYKHLHIDHMIPLSLGGAMYHPGNLMTMNSTFHGRKSKLEVGRDSPLIAAMKTDYGLIPENRSDIFKIIISPPRRSGHRCEIVW